MLFWKVVESLRKLYNIKKFMEALRKVYNVLQEICGDYKKS